MNYTAKIALDVACQPTFKCVRAKQGDSNSRFVNVTITKDGVVFPVPRTASAAFRAGKPDGSGIYNPATIEENGTVTAELTAQTLAVAGTVIADLLIIDVGADEDSANLATVSFSIIVDENPLGNVDITSESEWLIIQGLVDEAAAAAAAAASGASSASSHASAAAASADAAAVSAATAKNYADNIADPVSGLVTDWLKENVNPATGYVIDKSLTVEDAAADGKATGEAITEAERKALAAFPRETVSDSIALFSDGSEDIPVKNLKVHIEPVQEGSGDPSPENVRPITGWTGVNIAVADSAPNEEKVYEIELIQEGSGDPSPDNVRPIKPALSFEREDGTTLDVYGGTLDATTRVLTVDWIKGLEVTSVGSASDLGNNMRGGITPFTDRDLPIEPTLTNAISNLLPRRSAGYNKDQIGFYFYDIFRGYIFLPKTALNSADLAGVNEFLAAHPFYVVYKLATPITYQLTPAEVTRALAALGITANTYSVTFPSEAGTVYGGTLDVTTGLLTVDRLGIEFKNGDGWTEVSDGEKRFFHIVDNRAISSNDIPKVSRACSHFRNARIITSNTEIGYTAYSQEKAKSTLLQIRPGVEGITTVDDWGAWITAQYDAGTPLTCWYKPLTPVTYQLAPQEVKTLLGGNAIWADAGDVSLTYRADPTKYVSKKLAELQALILEQ